MSMSESPDGPRISRRKLLEGAGALGLSAASSSWLGPTRAVAVSTANPHAIGEPRLTSADHLALDYLPSQPTGWPPEQHGRGGVGVTIGGHVTSVPFTVRGTSYELSLLAFGQPGDAPDPVYEGEPSDPTIDFKRTLQKAWGAYYSFNYTGGFTGDSAISVQSYSTNVIEPTTTRPQLTYGCDLFMAYEPDPATGDPPITADLRWIQVTHTGGRSSTEFARRACPYYFPGGFTSVYGKPACSFYCAPTGGIGVGAPGKGHTTGPTLSDLVMLESFLVLDTGQKDHAGKGIIDVYGGVNWGYQLRAARS
jgi:hypothetical protein